MKIKNLKINGFGKLENKELEFTDGINLIVGKNEAGKSTLLKFITSMFYGVSRTKNGKTIADYERYKPWEKDQYSGKLTYELDNGEEYEIYREFKKKSPILYDKDKNDVTKNYSIDTSKGSLFFTEQTGVKEENFFASSAVEQEGVQLSDKARSSVIQKLSNIVLSGNENTSYNLAADRIARKQMEEIGTNRSSGRPINLIEEKIAKLEQQKAEIEKIQDFKYQVENKKEDLKNNLEENQTILDILRQQKVNLEKKQLEKEKIRISEELLNKEQEQIAKMEEKLENIDEPKIEKNRTPKCGYIICLVAVIATTTIALITKVLTLITANIIPILVVIILQIKQKQRKEQIKQQNKKIRQEKMQLESELTKVKNEKEKQEKEIKEKKEKIQNEQRENEEKTKENFKNKLEEATIEDILSTKYEKIVEYIDEKEREKTEYKIKEKTIDVDNKNIMKKLDELVEIDEKLEELYEKKNSLIELNSMYEMVKGELDSAYREMKEKITPAFIEDLKDILKTVTKGKYNNVYIDNDNNILIETQNGTYQEVDRLSTGTIDLIYLALRISAAKEISNENIPIIMDESFAYYDTERMTEIIKYLQNLPNRQVIIFTCSEREINILTQKQIPHNQITL